MKLVNTHNFIYGIWYPLFKRIIALHCCIWMEPEHVTDISNLHTSPVLHLGTRDASMLAMSHTWIFVFRTTSINQELLVALMDYIISQAFYNLKTFNRLQSGLPHKPVWYSIWKRALPCASYERARVGGLRSLWETVINNYQLLKCWQLMTHSISYSSMSVARFIESLYRKWLWNYLLFFLKSFHTCMSKRRK